MRLDGTTVLLTGATGGIGHAIARTLHAKGAALVLTGRRTEVLEPLAGELGARTVAADLALPAAVDRLLDEAGPVDVLVANAALPASGFVLELEPDDIGRAMQVNLLAPMAMARALGPAMVERGRGHLAFVSSLAGMAASPGSAIYNASKFGLRGFALGLRGDLAGTGVGVSVIAPGFLREAGMVADTGVTLPRGVRTSSPQEVADGVVRAIEGDKGEVIVAPFELRVGAAIGAALPGLSALVQRRIGSDTITREMARAQSHKR
jgi:short-subunit dehydrogenase